nr:TPA_asm: putative glycoprotein [Belostoma flumineum mononega-like virus]
MCSTMFGFCRYLLIMGFLCVSVNGLIGYDCGSSRANITLLSMGYIKSCPEQVDATAIENINVQLLQSREYDKVFVRACMVTRVRVIYHCGMHSHTSIAREGLVNEVVTSLSKQQCKMMHEEGWYRTDLGVMVSGLKVNATSDRAITEAGSVTTNNGECEGVSLSINGIFYSKVVVTSTYRFILRSYLTTVDVSDSKVVFPSGQVFNIHEEEGFDVHDGKVIWESSQLTPACSPFSSLVLYEGPAHLYTSPDNTRIVVLNTSDYTFALTLRKPELICHQHGYATDHPKLFVLYDIGRNHWFFKKSSMQSENVDLFLYSNSKFVYLERHFRGQLLSAYNNLQYKICMLRYNQLHSLISIAYIRPEEFAWSYTQTPGVTAVTKGEVLYLIKCAPVVVQFRTDSRCFQEIPVVYNNKSVYLAPRTRIIREYAEEIECNPIVPALYRWEDQWFQLQPHPISVKAPADLSLDVGESWNYQHTSNLMTSGLYSSDILQQYQKRLLFPLEREAITYTSAGKMAGINLDSQGLDIGGLLSEASIEKLHESLFTRIYGWYAQFAMHVSGLGGIIMFLYIIKSTLNMIINGTLLYKAYGVSYKLLATIWGTLAKHILIFKIINDTKENQPAPSCPDSTTDPESSPMMKGTSDNNDKIYPDLQTATIKIPGSTYTY